eukprot:scaffold5529_cov117-Cylindrotheca_fusiformis.AAC.30
MRDAIVGEKLLVMGSRYRKAVFPESYHSMVFSEFEQRATAGVQEDLFVFFAWFGGHISRRSHYNSDEIQPDGHQKDKNLKERA